ncbi:threonine ammonia-lyase, biosynthetic [Photobacterium phosphoreum]|uniref:threonine ammonia-lyase, biosynthetic n=1 Tax=Photobacterium phosphoreum TaxID=659 RepID=UPI0005D39A56|nr:threonine ammonia-lyase, biosynthetic [Photobacterium phosphoreum]KJF86417.1 threonine dehydratase [Photobacterium phosphoreum]MCD9472340.1 threonine ammonia-lyase, biosynthetic [Photobacterium phosphoreum]MCD9484955.1 threonine ammonia-lyase, biosynthetic [Photobacterium phosphoreum]MCD9512539.1 threonine ammonia-lyase, biosynthetic [Photobacterium phosphoreum]OBU40418.1 PLP-dependent threonine dehydratase [Photobacterium phosphoreum]
MADVKPVSDQYLLSGADYLRNILRAPVYEIAQVTPLQSMTRLSARIGNHIQLKREDRQPVHSFKLRGAYNMMTQLTESQRQAGVIAASAGNHAQGLALSSQKLGVSATIVMPRTTPDIKVDAVRGFGGNVILHGNNFDEAKIHAEMLAQQHGYTFIPPFDHPAIIAGQGTIGIELVQQNGHLEYVFVPVGGGGLAAGVSVLLKQLLPEIKVIGVEAEDSACLKAALDAGQPVTLDQVGMFADGVAVKRIGNETFRLCEQYLDDVITVSSDEICSAVKDIFEDTRAIAEPSGALSLAGLKKYAEQHQLQQRHLAAILSGANLNFHGLRYVSERCELGEKREGLLAVTIPERAGAFLEFCHLIGGRAVTEFNYRYNDNKLANVFVGVRLIQGQVELDQIITDLRQGGYPVMDLSDDEIAKVHVRYMIGGRPSKPLQERLYSFEFPEYPGALAKFLSTLGSQWNISLFNYRNHGADYGRVLCGFELADHDLLSFASHLRKLGYHWHDETDSAAYKFFLAQ